MCVCDMAGRARSYLVDFLDCGGRKWEEIIKEVYWD